MKDLVNYSYIINGEDSLGFMNSGTGTIIRYNESYYLLSNFHVLTGKDYQTNKKLPAVRDTVTSISIIFQPLKKGMKFLVYIYPLYSNGKPNFLTYKFQDQLIDLSVMAIKIPKEASLYAIQKSDFDTLCNHQPNSKLYSFGFPGGKFVNGWEPTLLEANSISNPQTGKNIYDPYIFLDKTPVFGTSGSPVYHYTDKALKLLSIISNQGDANSLLKGRSICSSLALELIKTSYSQGCKAVGGVKYQYKLYPTQSHKPLSFKK